MKKIICKQNPLIKKPVGRPPATVQRKTYSYFLSRKERLEVDHFVKVLKAGK